MALDFIAGCVGGSAGVIVGYPLDTVKTHLQVQDGKNPKYRGTLHCFKSILVQEGARGLYRGVQSPLVGLAGINALVFGVYGYAMKNLPNPDTLTSVTIAGSISGLVQSFICGPTELIKSRMQVLYANSSIKTFDYMKQICVKEGIKGLYRGLNITIVREVPAFASYFACYEYLIKTPDNSPSTLRMLWAGGIAGMVSWSCIYPIDVIKSRIQLDGVTETKYKNSFDCLRKSIKAEGYGCLFRGLSPTLIRAFPVNGCTFVAVTWTLKIFGDDGFFKKNTSRESDSLWDAIRTVKVMDAV